MRSIDQRDQDISAWANRSGASELSEWLGRYHSAEAAAEALGLRVLPWPRDAVGNDVALPAEPGSALVGGTIFVDADSPEAYALRAWMIVVQFKARQLGITSRVIVTWQASFACHRTQALRGHDAAAPFAG